MKFNLCYYPEGSEMPTASVRIEVNDYSRLEKLCQGTEEFLEDVGKMAETAWSCCDKLAVSPYDKSASGRVVYGYDRFREEKELFLNEEDAIACVFYGCFIIDTPDDYGEKIENSEINSPKSIEMNNGNMVHKYVHGYIPLEGLTVTIDHKGDIYTDITKAGMITSRLGIGGVRFIAKKNGGEPAVHYLMTKTVGVNGVYEDYAIMQSPSFGIIEADPKIQYAGNSLCFKEPMDHATSINTSSNAFSYADKDDNVIISVPGDGFVYDDSYTDKDGNVIISVPDDLFIDVYEDYDVYEDSEKHVVSVVHLFFERDGKNFTFSVLKNGELHKKISKTDDAVIFYHTPFYCIRLAGFFDKKDMNFVFRKTNGKYLHDEFELSSNLSINKAINTVITMPPMPEGDGANVLHAFYLDCVEALYKAFENSEMYYTTKYQWSPRETVEIWSDKTRNNFAADNPPACQIDIKRVDNYMHTFLYENTEITARASIPRDRMEDFQEFFTIPFPGLSVDSIAFIENGSTIALKPANNVLDVKITDAETKQIFEGKFGLLRLQPDFDSTGIPSNLYLDPDWLKVKGQFNLYKKIKDAIVKFGIKPCESLFEDDDTKNREAISKILYGRERMVPDENIISIAAQLKNEYKRTKMVPHIAIVGQAGTGKTTLAKNLGKIFGKDVLALTPSDLRGAYIGHTKFEVVQRLAEAAENNQILYLDEAYQLMEDKYGHEAITVLLPLMTGSQTKVEASLDKGQNDIIELDFGDAITGRKGRLKITNVKLDKIKKDIELEPGIVPIWISGYENEVRMMISQNQGLYRRLKKVVIKTPVTSDLLKQFDGELERFAKSDDKTSRKAAMLQKHFNNNGIESVKKFFVWGSEPQNSKYFASHAGVSNFVKNCIDSIDFGKDLGHQIEDIIISNKLDIKRQLSTVRTGSGNSPYNNVPDAIDTINVVTDIDIRFSDLVGCDSQISYMQSIIDMLVNKGIYEDSRLTIPKGALMEGLPGTGKTFIASAMAGELQERFQRQAPDKRFGFMSFSASSLGNKPASYIASVFNTAEEYDACILFIDEVDAIAKHRNNNRFYDCYLELIKQMDGIEKRSNIFILAATNAPENLDPAFVRSGRIDKNLVFSLPDKAGREELARRAIQKRLKTLVNFNPKGKEEDIDSVAKRIAARTLGFTAGDIDNVINNAFITYHQFTHRNDPGSSISKDFFKSYSFIKYNQGDRLKIDATKYKNVTKDTSLQEICAFIDEEIERMEVGAPNFKKREEKFNTDRNGNCSSTAIHEVGHAVLSLMLGERPFDIITTIPRGNVLGYVSHSELNMVTKSDYENRIHVSMGGRIAEEIIYGKDNISVGAVSDMRNATDIARRMIEMWGFSDEFGFMALSEPAWKYLGNINEYTCSDAFREKSDIAVKELLKRLYEETFKMLADKKELIVNLARYVFYNETVTGEEFKRQYEEELERCCP